MLNVKVKAITESGEVLDFKEKEFNKFDAHLTVLENNYVLSNYTLYRIKGNVLCGEKVNTKELTIQITRVN